MRGRFLLAIDAGTSSTRTVIYDHRACVVASAQREFAQLYPQPGWVEHDPEEIWSAVEAVTAEAMQAASANAADITGIGITNQRETTVLWERASGRCIYNAIVWQDRRTARDCDAMKADGRDATIAAKTGLRLDPYFSASKIAWLLNNVPGARERANAGELAFGTIDSFILWRLCNGRVHATDASNASRTMLFNIHTQQWDEELLELFAVPRSLLPEVHDLRASSSALRSTWSSLALSPLSMLRSAMLRCFTSGRARTFLRSSRRLMPSILACNSSMRCSIVRLVMVVSLLVRV
jgi:glycerol kinase